MFLLSQGSMLGPFLLLLHGLCKGKCVCFPEDTRGTFAPVIPTSLPQAHTSCPVSRLGVLGARWASASSLVFLCF